MVKVSVNKKKKQTLTPIGAKESLKPFWMRSRIKQNKNNHLFPMATELNKKYC
jgi:hypothetical protein